MKKVIWRPKAVSRPALILIAILAAIGMLMVEQLRVMRQRPYYEEKLTAAQLAQQAFDAVKSRRMRILEIDPEHDPNETGLIGVNMSSITSVNGVLPSKQTSVNPNFAAVVVDMLKRAGVKEGDVVGLGLSGSFPALNICSIAAVETLGAKPVIISSGAASQWGANLSDFLWVEMEKELYDQGVFEHRSVAVSIGGDEDRGDNLQPDGRTDILAAFERAELTDKMINAPDFTAAIDRRMEIMRKEADRQSIMCYINVGGGAVSAGTSVGKKMFDEGLNMRPPLRMPADLDGVMPRMSKLGVPVIHLVQVVDLAERYGLPVVPQPDQRELLQPGKGAVFQGVDYNKPLAAGVLVAIVAALFGFIRSDIGFRLLQGGHQRKAAGHPEPMV